MKRFKPMLTIVAGLYACWLGMMAVHEAGHVLHARLTGGIVDRVSIPLFGFSQTFYVYNPDKKFVAWGGPLWGCLIPILFLAGTYFLPRRARQCAQFFAGFCLVANGAYMGIGWTMRAGDAGDLLRYGTAAWVLIAVGAIAFVIGLYLWHRLGANRAPPANDS